MNSNNTVILFDGVCNLCNASVQEIIKRDTEGRFHFASLQSDFGQNFLKKNQLSTQDFDSFILVFPTGEYKTKSNAVIEILKGLPNFYPFLGKVFGFLPEPLRNGVYQFIAQNRYRIFGKKESCMIPKPEWKNRFID